MRPQRTPLLQGAEMSVLYAILTVLWHVIADEKTTPYAILAPRDCAGKLLHIFDRDSNGTLARRIAVTTGWRPAAN